MTKGQQQWVSTMRIAMTQRASTKVTSEPNCVQRYLSSVVMDAKFDTLVKVAMPPHTDTLALLPDPDTLA